MKINLIFFILFFFSTKSIANSIFIDISDSRYNINFQKLRSEDKSCFFINCIKSEISSDQKIRGLALKPLIVFKVFDWKMIKSGLNVSHTFLTLDDYCKKNVIPALVEDMKINVGSLRQLTEITPVNTFDTLIVLVNRNYEVYTGFVMAEFFNLISFRQFHVLQSNRTILNIEAPIVRISAWVGDSLPVPDVDEMLNNKIFLLKREGNEFTFFCHPSSCSDCALNFYNEYVYRRDYGIIAFKSKYVTRIKNSERATSSIMESENYYYFR